MNSDLYLEVTELQTQSFSRRIHDVNLNILGHIIVLKLWPLLKFSSPMIHSLAPLTHTP